MRSLFQAEARTTLQARLHALEPDARPRWGRLTAPAMVDHVTSCLRMMTGDLPVRPEPTPWMVRNPPLRQLLIYVLPFPKNLATSPELIVPAPKPWEASLAACDEMIERVGARSPSGLWPTHPAFGAMSGLDWAVLQYRHADHHLRQFGV
jgi:hypothetical protein